VPAGATVEFLNSDNPSAGREAQANRRLESGIPNMGISATFSRLEV